MRSAEQVTDACDRCIRRTWLLTRLAGHLDLRRRLIWESLELSDSELIGAVGGELSERLLTEWGRFGAPQARTARTSAVDAGLEFVCRCSDDYPARLRALAAPPAVLHIAGGAARLHESLRHEPVAIVGARRATSYGRGVTRSLARSLGVAGCPVVSGMAPGIDSEAHGGALERGAATIAVLPGSADRSYPAVNAPLHRRLLSDGVVVSELAPGAPVRRWTFVARNRIIAGLAELTIVVEAAPGSGSLLTAAAAQLIGKPVGAVPGPVTSRLSIGPNQLLADGALLVRDAQDVLDGLYGAGAKRAHADDRPTPTSEQAQVLAAISEGTDTAGALISAGIVGGSCLAELGALELAGRIRRAPGGRFVLIP